MKWGLILLCFMLALAPSVYAQGKVVVLSSDNSADYAVARVWAQKLGATVVTTPWGSLSTTAINNIVFSQATIVYVVGGTVAVPNAEDELKDYGKTVIRAGGLNRKETSNRVAERIGVKRAVVLDGYDTTAMEDAVTIGSAEGIPIIYLHRTDPDFGNTLRKTGIEEITLFSNPSLEGGVKNSLAQANIKITEIQRDDKVIVQKIINRTEEQLNKTGQIVRSIIDGPTLAAARLIVESKISLSKARTALSSANYQNAFIEAVLAEELSGYSEDIYNGRYPGRVLDLVAQGNKDILSMGVDGAKKNLKDLGAPYGVGIPVPPISGLESYLVDIPGYIKSQIGPGIEYDMGGKYTKAVGKSVKLEIFKMSSEMEAIKWVEQIQFSPGVISRDWNIITFMGYPASIKMINYTVSSEKKTQEIYLRVAVGNLGIFSKFTESVSIYSNLTPQNEAQAMVEEIASKIISVIEAGD